MLAPKIFSLIFHVFLSRSCHVFLLSSLLMVDAALSNYWALLIGFPNKCLLLSLLSGSIPMSLLFSPRKDQRLRTIMSYSFIELHVTWINVMLHTPLIEGGNMDVSYCRSRSEHLPLLFLPSQVPAVLCFAHRSPLVTFSNPLTLSLPLSYFSTFSDCWSVVDRPFLLLVYPPHLSLLLIIFSSPPFPPPPPPTPCLSPRPSFPRTSSAAVVYIHIAPATTCWFSCWRAAHRVIRITARTPARIRSIRIQFPSLKLPYFFQIEHSDEAGVPIAHCQLVFSG